MNQQIRELMQKAGTDVSGKWMSVDNAEKFAELVIQAYIQEQQQKHPELAAA